MQRRIGLYGGSFNPVHRGHLELARRVGELFSLDEVWLIPAHVPPHKSACEVAPSLHRHAMLALATQNAAQLKISTIEFDAPHKPFTIETVALVQKRLPEARLFFMMGADSWMEITTWREWKKLLTIIEVIVVTRPQYEIEVAHVGAETSVSTVDLRMQDAEAIELALHEASPSAHQNAHRDALPVEDSNRQSGGKKIYFTDAVRLDIAASEVRRRVQSGESIEADVPREVASYILKYGLYKETDDTKRQQRERLEAQTGCGSSPRARNG